MYSRAGLIVLVLLSACSNNGDKPLAVAFTKKLYYTDYAATLHTTDELTAADSLQQLNAFVNNWIKDCVLAHKAEENLSADEKDVNALLEAYKNSLLVFRYQQKLISDRLDTNVTDKEMRSYFEANKDNFILHKNIVKLRFVKVNTDNRTVSVMKRLIRRDDAKSRMQLAGLCKMNAVNYFLDDETWLEWDDVKKEIPLPAYNDEHFLKNNKYLEIPEGQFIYLVNLQDYRTQQSTSDFEFERDKIRKIILQQRSIALIKQAEADILNEAIGEGQVQVNME
ncbi:MAG: hypothetical protein ACK45I_06930 [Bacteroidota bacterium]|jgi:hypothetical protein